MTACQNTAMRKKSESLTPLATTVRINSGCNLYLVDLGRLRFLEKSELYIYVNSTNTLLPVWLQVVQLR